MKEFCSKCGRPENQTYIQSFQFGGSWICEWCSVKKAAGKEKMSTREAYDYLIKDGVTDKEKMVYLLTRLADIKFEAALRFLRRINENK